MKWIKRNKINYFGTISIEIHYITSRHGFSEKNKHVHEMFWDLGMIKIKYRIFKTHLHEWIILNIPLYGKETSLFPRHNQVTDVKMPCLDFVLIYRPQLRITIYQEMVRISVCSNYHTSRSSSKGPPTLTAIYICFAFSW